MHSDMVLIVGIVIALLAVATRQWCKRAPLRALRARYERLSESVTTASYLAPNSVGLVRGRLSQVERDLGVLERLLKRDARWDRVKSFRCLIEQRLADAESMHRQFQNGPELLAAASAVRHHS